MFSIYVKEVQKESVMLRFKSDGEEWVNIRRPCFFKNKVVLCDAFASKIHFDKSDIVEIDMGSLKCDCTKADTLNFIAVDNDNRQYKVGIPVKDGAVANIEEIPDSVGNFR